MSVSRSVSPEEQKAIELTSYMVHKHYCENDVEAVSALFDDDLLWVGAGEHEHGIGGRNVREIFRRFAGLIPPCNVSEEEYHTLKLAPDVYLCSGRMWISTDSSTQISIRVHQRITTVFRRVGESLRCCHIHISNPYDEMAGDVGFPIQMSLQTYTYLQEQIERQKRQIADQTALLERLSFEDTLSGLFNRNKFNTLLENGVIARGDGLGVACFDLNGLKEINDTAGHSAGDDLIRRASSQFRRFFPASSYRIGGDEFVVLEDQSSEEAFLAAVGALQAAMQKDGISCSAGICWRKAPGDLTAQYEEADRQMYENKRRFYSQPEHDRRE